LIGPPWRATQWEADEAPLLARLAVSSLVDRVLNAKRKRERSPLETGGSQAWKVYGAQPSRLLSWQLRCPSAAVIDRYSPWLMAR